MHEWSYTIFSFISFSTLLKCISVKICIANSITYVFLFKNSGGGLKVDICPSKFFLYALLSDWPRHICCDFFSNYFFCAFLSHVIYFFSDLWSEISGTATFKQVTHFFMYFEIAYIFYYYKMNRLSHESYLY